MCGSMASLFVCVSHGEGGVAITKGGLASVMLCVCDVDLKP